MSCVERTIVWYDRMQLALDACRREALGAGDMRRARRALMLCLRANDRAELLAESPSRA